MDSLGTEVGQKMRSAVKAKLCELGTGSTTGYIDDELPDYVMIMVANKRSKKQMRDDLNLFLGDNTDSFVNWLHQVLEKLNEVTLPMSASQKVDGGKKDKKRDKKQKKSLKDLSPEKGAGSEVTPSITDVFADHLIGKAKKSMEQDSQAPIKKQQESHNDKPGGGPSSGNRNEFNIPTISEMAKSAVVNSKLKELDELEQIQKQINEAKRQLRSIDTVEEEKGEEEVDDDEDLLNLKADETYGDDDEQLAMTSPKATPAPKRRTPIVFDRNDDNRTPPLPESRPVRERLNNKDMPPKKPENIISLSAHRKMERELYVPSFRRDAQAADEPNRERHQRDERRIETRPTPINRDSRPVTRISRHTTRDRNRSPERQEHVVREKRGHEMMTRERNERPEPTTNVRQRIGSRVIVAPPKPPYEESDIDVPVNSVVKVKPRPIVPKNKQANKNLLLRAVAEAQKSIVSSLTRKLETPIERHPNNRVQSRLGRRTAEPAEEVDVPPKKKKIIVEVAQNNNSNNTRHSERTPLTLDSREERRRDDHSPMADEDDDVYVPYPVNNLHGINVAMPAEEDTPPLALNTQFVVTLDGGRFGGTSTATTNKKTDARHLNVVTEKELKIQLVAENPLNEPEVEDLRASALKTVKSREGVKRPRKEASPSRVADLRTKVDEKKRKTAAQQERRSPVTRKRKSPVQEERRKSVERPAMPALKRKEESGNSPKRIRISAGQKVEEKGVSKITWNGSTSTDRRSEEGHRPASEVIVSGKEKRDPKKYDNIPQLSSVAIPASVVKPMERCKYYPSCGKGDSCEFMHPTTNCKAFPSCKFGDKCLYIHPMCKFDLTCTRPDCNFAHTPVSSAAPPLASHVVPVQNYKTIAPKPLPAMCKYYPQCANKMCNFYHPKLCKFGKMCINKVECNFYHHDFPASDKFKWVAPTTC